MFLLRCNFDLNICLFVCYSNQQRSGANALLQSDEQKRRLHVGADVRNSRVQQQKRRGTEYHLCQLCR